MAETEFRDRLTARLDEEFDCTDGEIESVVEAAAEMRRSLDENDGGLGRREKLSAEEVIDNLREAPDGLSVQVRWNYWAGSVNYFDSEGRSFAIDDL